MFRKAKKAFTLVEIVIVMCVIAVLSSVLVPTFLGLIEKAKLSATVQLTKTLNTALATNKVNWKNVTFSEALEDMEGAGYSLEKITPTAEGYHLCWDEDADKMVILDEDYGLYYSEDYKVTQNKGHLWKIANSKSDLIGNFSYYLTEKFNEENIEVAYGLDSSKSAVKNVKLTNTEKVNVSLKVAPTTSVEINMPNGVVNHYGEAQNVTIVEVANSSYHLFGQINGNLNLEKGRVEIASNAKVNGNLVILATDTAKIKVDIVNVESVKNVISAAGLDLKTTQVIPQNIPVTLGKKVTNGNFGESFKTEGYYCLTENITYTINESLTLNQNIVLDTNGYNITLTDNTGSGFIVSEGVDVKFENSKSTKSTISVTNNVKTMIYLCKNSKFLLGKNVELSGKQTVDYGIRMAEDGVKLTLNGEVHSKQAGVVVFGKGSLLNVYGKIYGGAYYGISGNGIRTLNSTINIYENAYIESEGTAIYHPHPGTVNVYGGVLVGIDTGIEMRAGTLNVYGGKITALLDEFSIQGNGNGTTTKGVAVAIAQHTTEYGITVNISGGELNGIKALHEQNIQQNIKIQVSIIISGGTLNGEIYSENCQNFITDGKFNKTIDDKYLA